jgi:hypothetical protein
MRIVGVIVEMFWEPLGGQDSPRNCYAEAWQNVEVLAPLVCFGISWEG